MLFLTFSLLLLSARVSSQLASPWGTFTPEYLEPPALPRQGAFGTAFAGNGSAQLGFWGAYPTLLPSPVLCG